MSGGHWGYENDRVRELVERVADDAEVTRRFPLLAIELAATAAVLGEIMHDLDWDLSGDTSIKDDSAFEREALQKLGSPLRRRRR